MFHPPGRRQSGATMKPDLTNSYVGLLLRVREPHALPRLPLASSLCAIVLGGLDELDELDGMVRKILQLYCLRRKGSLYARRRHFIYSGAVGSHIVAWKKEMTGRGVGN
jgi:hypothetical protein